MQGRNFDYAQSRQIGLHHDFGVPEPALIQCPVEYGENPIASKKLVASFGVPERNVEAPSEQCAIALAHETSVKRTETEIVDAQSGCDIVA